MRIRCYFILCCLLLLAADASAMVSRDSLSAADRHETDSLFHELLTTMRTRQFAKLPIGDRVVAVAKLFIEKPYLDKTLEVGNDEDAICNFDGFDCVTMFENAWAMARIIKRPGTITLDDYALELAKTRYRNGKPNGFNTRLHYTTDYFYQNTKNGLLKEVTGIVGKDLAELNTDSINFMSYHPSSYKQIRTDTDMRDSIRAMENSINARGGFYYIRKQSIADVESRIQSGDLIGITTSISGIDCSHTGIAVREKDGRIHFLHASSLKRKVILSPMPLADYTASQNRQTGIIIYRPQEVQ